MQRKLVLFPTARHTIQAEKICRSNNIDTKVVTTPSTISNECGMSLEFNPNFSTDELETIFNNNNIPYRIITI